MEIEKNIEKIETIVESLSDARISLSDSIKLYEEGVLLASEVITELKGAKGKIVELTKTLNSLKESDFGDDDE